MRSALITVVVVLAASAGLAHGANIEASGWETFPVGDTGAGIYATDAPQPTDCTEPLLGKYGDIDEIVVDDIVHSGSRALKLTDQDTGTPQAYVGWITGLQTGDEVTAGLWFYDTTPSASPSGRIWGHYTDAGGTINDYAGSASGNYTYPDGTGWSYLEWTWTFDDDGGTRDGLVIEARTYGDPGAVVYVDDLTITAPDASTITKPELPEPATMALLGLGGLFVLRRRRA